MSKPTTVNYQGVECPGCRRVDVDVTIDCGDELMRGMEHECIWCGQEMKASAEVEVTYFARARHPDKERDDE